MSRPEKNDSGALAQYIRAVPVITADESSERDSKIAHLKYPLNLKNEMKKQANKGRDRLLKPSPNEEANILLSEKERRKKLRLKQIREQEKAFSRKVLEDARKRKNVEIKELACHLKDQWETEHNKKQSDLEKKYQENLAEVGLGHKTASEDQTEYTKPELTEEEKQRALERYKKAVEQLMYERARSTQSERERAEARQQALETERRRAAKIAALPPPVDPIGDLDPRKDHSVPDQKKLDSFSTSRFHLRPIVHVERDLDLSQEDAREAAKDEEERMQVILEEVQRDKAEQIEKARLRHKHALAQLQLEEDHKKLMEELDSLERHDRQRRQEAVARIPVRIFQPPHKRLEDAEDRQRDLEQAFEDMYMMQTGYTGDLTVALEPPGHLRPASEDSIQSGSGERPAEPEERKQPPRSVPSAVVPDRSAERVEHDSEPEMEPEREPLPDGAPKGPSEDPLRRLLQRIERQRDQWRRRQPTEEAPPQAAVTTGIRRSVPSTVPQSKKQEFRIPDSIPFSAAPEPIAEVELSEEEEEAEDGRPDMAEGEDGHPAPGLGSESDIPHPAVSEARTLLHPLEAAQRSRTTTPIGRTPTAQLSQQEALLEQQKLKLQLQQQNLLQQQLEQQLQDYQRQLADIYGHVDVPEGPLAPGVRSLERMTLEEPFSGRAPYEEGSSLPDTTLEELDVTQHRPFPVRAPYDTVPQTVVPKSTSQEGSPLLSETLESSTLGSVTSDETEMTSEFQRTLETARATAEKAAQLRQKERDVLEELGRVPLEDVPFSSDPSHPERDISSGSASSLQSDALVSVSTPSTLSLSVTLSSDLSVTAAMSRTTQSGTFRDTDHVYPLTSQIRSGFSDVADTVSMTAATSLLTKTTQSVGFARPLSSSARQFSVLTSGSEPYTRTASGLPYTLPSSGANTEFSGRNPLAFATASSGPVQSRTIGVSQLSAFQQSTRSGYSPGYLDYYYQKIEEERQLFEVQRNRIRRYSDSHKKMTPEGPRAQAYQAPGRMSKNVPPIEPLMRTSPYVLEQYGRVPTYLERRQGESDKENQGYIANSTGFMGQDRLQDISQRLSAFEKSITSGTISTVVTSSSYAPKPLSTSDWSRGSSTEYMSLPRETAGAGARGSAGSTLSTLSELTEMMTRLTSTSDESDVTSLKSRDVSGAIRGQSSGGRGRQVGYAPKRAGPGSSLGQSSLTGLEGNINLRGTSRDQLYVPSSVLSSDTRGPPNDAHLYVPMEQSAKSSAPVEPLLSAPGSRWTRGSDGKQWFVLSRSHTLSSGGGLLEKDMVTPGEVGVDSVFPDDEVRSPVSGREETGSVSSASLSSGTLHSGTADNRLDESLAASNEPRALAPSTVS
ncbi:hypothetical protein ACROYT_G029640 [Oculina patagonica]